MIKKERLTKLLDELRHSKHIKLSDFTENIISERNYRRYINDKQALPFNVFVELVQRLKMQMSDFLIYALNKTSIDFQQEIYLEHYIKNNQLEAADKLFEDMDHSDYQTHIGSLYLPIIIKKYFYLKNKITKRDYLEFANQHIDITALKKHQVIDRQHLEVLLLLLQDADEHTKQSIIPIVYDIIIQKKPLISFKVSSDLNHAVQILTQTLFTNDTFKSSYQDLLKPLLDLSLKQLKSTHFEPGYKDFLTYAIVYYQSTEDISMYRRYVYYYVSYILSNAYTPLDLNDPFTKSLLENPEIEDILTDGLKNGYLLSNEVIS